MTLLEPITTGQWTERIDACDRCLALSTLAVYVAQVPMLRGTPKYFDRLRAAQAARGEETEELVLPTLSTPQLPTAIGLPPTPAALVCAAHGVSAERASDLGKRLADWSADWLRARCGELGVQAVCECSTDYPGSLRELSDPPPVLYLTGDARLLLRCPDDAIGMVGTRRPTRVGREAARNIAGGIARTGGVVVSGMAFGVDGAAHDGALAVGGLTIAVLAGGVEVSSPPSHRQLYGEIRGRGLVVSELPPGTRPTRWTFPARNRIIAGLSSAVVVVEAPLRSGALITVDHAHDLGIDVYAVPGSLASVTCEGSNRLLCEGAGGVVDGVDLMAIRNEARGVTVAARLVPHDPAQAALHEALTHGPQGRDELARLVAGTVGAGELDDALLELEVGGWIDRGLDGRYRLPVRTEREADRAA